MKRRENVRRSDLSTSWPILGGLVTRAYMAGLAPVPYHDSNKIRKLVLAGSPAYGTGLARLCEAFTETIQCRQMSFGGRFLGGLHERWTSLIKEDPQVRTNSFALVGVCARDGDGAVPYASAAMKSGLVGAIKYIPARHADQFLVNRLCSEEPIVGADDEEHLGYQFIRDFLLDKPLGEDYKSILGVTRGMLITQLYDRETGDGVRVTKIQIDGKDYSFTRNRSTLTRNRSTEVVTLLRLKAGKRRLSLVPPVAYQPPGNIDVIITAGQARVKLVPVQKK